MSMPQDKYVKSPIDGRYFDVKTGMPVLERYVDYLIYKQDNHKFESSDCR